MNLTNEQISTIGEVFSVSSATVERWKEENPRLYEAAWQYAVRNGLLKSLILDPVESLALSVSTTKALKREGIHSVCELSTRSVRDLLSIPYLGKKAVNSIVDSLHSNHGIALPYNKTDEAGL